MGTVHLHPRSSERAATLAQYARDVDERRYRCPAGLGRKMDRLLEPDGPFRVLALTGPGGSGKSAALREIGRRAHRAQWPVLSLDARIDDVVDVLDGLVEGPPRVIVVDEAGTLGPSIAAVGASLANLPEQTRLVVAGRTLPPRWLPQALEPLVGWASLGALDPHEADALLDRYEVHEAGARAQIVAWAGGLPLALVVAAAAWAMAEDRDAEGAIEAFLAGSCGESLLRHLVDAALDRLDPDLLAVLVLAAGVDRPLLVDLFGDRAEKMLADLCATSVVESVRGRLVLHPTLAELLARRLRIEEPGRVAAVTLRIAAHEHARAVAGEAGAVPRLAALVQDPGLRIGLGPIAHARHYADRWRPGDDGVVRAGLERHCSGSAAVIGPWLGDAARVVRRADGRPVAIVAVLPVEAAARTNGTARRLVAPVVAFARARGHAERAVISVVQVTFDDEAEPEVAWVRNAAGLAQCGLGNPQIDYVNLVGDVVAEHETLAAFGYTEIPELSRRIDGVPVSTWVADVGAGGLAGLLHAAISAEQGRAVPADAAHRILLAALEAFHSDAVLALLPVAPAGMAVPAAAEHARAWVRSRVTAVLAREPELLDLVHHRYLCAGATHQTAMRATYLSRATYFRRLRRARELLEAASMDR